MAQSDTPEKVYREVLVVPLAARREAFAIIILICLIVLLMAFRFSQVSTVDSRKSLKSYQLSDLYLKNQAPTLYRAIMGVVSEITYLREENGSWPDVTLLQEEALPPFAGNFLPIGLRGFVWERHANDGWVDYYGVNGDVGSAEKEGADPLENSFILRIIDLQSEDHPHPHFGQDNDPVIRYSSQIWMNPKLSDYPTEGLIVRGWKWIVSSSGGAGGNADGVIVEQPGK